MKEPYSKHSFAQAENAHFGVDSNFTQAADAPHHRPSTITAWMNDESTRIVLPATSKLPRTAGKNPPPVRDISRPRPRSGRTTKEIKDALADLEKDGRPVLLCSFNKADASARAKLQDFLDRAKWINGYVLVREFTQDGAEHLHGVISCRRAWDWDIAKLRDHWLRWIYGESKDADIKAAQDIDDVHRFCHYLTDERAKQPSGTRPWTWIMPAGIGGRWFFKSKTGFCRMLEVEIPLKAAQGARQKTIKAGRDYGQRISIRNGNALALAEAAKTALKREQAAKQCHDTPHTQETPRNAFKSPITDELHRALNDGAAQLNLGTFSRRALETALLKLDADNPEFLPMMRGSLLEKLETLLCHYKAHHACIILIDHAPSCGGFLYYLQSIIQHYLLSCLEESCVETESDLQAWLEKQHAHFIPVPIEQTRRQARENFKVLKLKNQPSPS